MTIRLVNSDEDSTDYCVSDEPVSPLGLGLADPGTVSSSRQRIFASRRLVYFLCFCFLSMQVWHFYSPSSVSPRHFPLAGPVRFAPAECPVAGKAAIWQAYPASLATIPIEVFDNIKRFAPGYEHRIYDDESIVQFMENQGFAPLVPFFRNIKVGPYKADLFRYAALWKCGGVWLDADIEPVPGAHVSDILEDLMLAPNAEGEASTSSSAQEITDSTAGGRSDLPRFLRPLDSQRRSVVPTVTATNSTPYYPFIRTVRGAAIDEAPAVFQAVLAVPSRHQPLLLRAIFQMLSVEALLTGGGGPDASPRIAFEAPVYHLARDLLFTGVLSHGFDSNSNSSAGPHVAENWSARVLPLHVEEKWRGFKEQLLAEQNGGALGVVGGEGLGVDGGPSTTRDPPFALASLLVGGTEGAPELDAGPSPLSGDDRSSLPTGRDSAPGPRLCSGTRQTNFIDGPGVGKLLSTHWGSSLKLHWMRERCVSGECVKAEEKNLLAESLLEDAAAFQTIRTCPGCSTTGSESQI